MEIKSESDLLKAMQKLMSSVTPENLRNNVNNIRYGSVVAVSTNAKIVDIRLAGTGQLLYGIKVQNGVSDIYIGQQCLILSPDPTLKTQVFAILF